MKGPTTPDEGSGSYSGLSELREKLSELALGRRVIGDFYVFHSFLGFQTI